MGAKIVTDHLSGYLDRVDSLLQRRPVGLLLDLDGTLSELGPDPEGSIVSPSILRALAEVRSKLDLVAVITGRSVAQAVGIVGMEGLAYVGNHGLERWERGSVVVAPQIQPYLEPLSKLLAGLRSKIVIPGIYFEDKGSSFAVHYRNTANPKRSEEDVLNAIDEVGREGVTLIMGALVVNVLPPVELSKGTAVATLVEENSLASAIYIGDDVTDLDAFREIARLQDGGGFQGLCIGVVGPESPEEIRAEADYILSSVAEVGWFLEWLAARVI